MDIIRDKFEIEYKNYYKFNTKMGPHDLRANIMERIVKLLKTKKMYNEKRIREPVRLKENCLDWILKVREEVAFDETERYLNSIEEFFDSEYVLAYTLSKPSTASYFNFEKIGPNDIVSKMSLSGDKFATLFLPHEVNIYTLECVFVKQKKVQEPKLYLNIHILVNKTDNKLGFDGLSYESYYMQSDIINTPLDFINMMVKTDNIVENLVEIEYRLGHKIFHKLFELRDGLLQ